MNVKDLSGIFLRYLILVLVALPGLYLFYLIFTPLTIYPAYWILSLFYHTIALQNNYLVINNYLIQIIPACIAGSAYYLLLILNLATPMKLKVRMKSLAFLIFSLLFLNIIRLVVFTALSFSGFAYFDLAHRLVWHFGSTLLVIILWFVSAFLFRISAIPAYTDLRRLYEAISVKKRKR